MLTPDQRELFIEQLRPPPGYEVEQAVGTTFSLDLHSLMRVPIAFLHQGGWLARDTNEERRELSILEALRRFSNCLTVFTQASQIKLPLNYPRLIVLMESCVVEVMAPTPGGVFHPKVWVLKFARRSAESDEPGYRYRVVCLSRNLTFDRSWDTLIALDGVTRSSFAKVRASSRLADFVESLPALAVANQRLSKERLKLVRSLADELRYVEFETPAPFERYAFHHNGDPFAGLGKGNALIISPFLSAGVVQQWSSRTKLTLISRPEELDTLSCHVLKQCAEVHTMAEASAGEVSDDHDELEGLHAKVYVFDDRWDAHVFSGSYNATNAAFQKNVEFMVQLTGKKSACGVAAFLPPPDKEVKSLRDLLVPYPITERSPIENTEKAWDDLCQTVRHHLAAADIALIVTGDYDLTLRVRGEWIAKPAWKLTARPLSLSSPQAQSFIGTDLSFANLSLDQLTSWVAFELSQGDRKSQWVTKAELVGAPADREQRILASLIDTREKLIQFLLLMLRLDSDDVSDGGDPFAFTAKGPGAAFEAPPLLELLLRAAHRSPQTLRRIHQLMTDLQVTSTDEELQNVWKPIQEALDLA